MEDSFKTKEEMLATLHQIVEHIDPDGLYEKIENAPARDFTFQEALGVARVMSALETLVFAINALEQTIDI